jgi:hypothetical protein
MSLGFQLQGLHLFAQSMQVGVQHGDGFPLRNARSGCTTSLPRLSQLRSAAGGSLRHSRCPAMPRTAAGTR